MKVSKISKIALKKRLKSLKHQSILKNLNFKSCSKKISISIMFKNHYNLYIFNLESIECKYLFLIKFIFFIEKSYRKEEIFPMDI